MSGCYGSPRWTGEIADCSMPMTFDTYSACSYNCLYCFAFFQRSHARDGTYLARQVKAVTPARVRAMFDAALAGGVEDQPWVGRQFAPYIANRVTMQWGGLSDAFDEHERRLGVSLELLRYFDEIDYPLSISTKGTWWTEDARYMDLFARHTHNWHVKVSIITADPFKARAIERGVAPPQERIEAIRRLAALGTHVTLRLRPYIIGISDDWRPLIAAAKDAGADSVTTEFFCLEARADPRLRAKYDEISKVAGGDVWVLYRDESSNKSGYRRLSYDIKFPIVTAMQEYAHALGLRFYVSDAHHKEKSDACCCCGVPPGWRVSKGHFAEALQIAKARLNRGEQPDVSWSEIAPDLRALVGGVPFARAEGYNTSSGKVRAQRIDQSLYDIVHELWNTPRRQNSPYNYFDGILYPVRVDEAGDVVYSLDTARMLRRTPKKRLPGGKP